VNPVSWTHRSESIFLVCHLMCINPGPEGFFSMLLIVASVIRRQNLPTRNEAEITVVFRRNARCASIWTKKSRRSGRNVCCHISPGHSNGFWSFLTIHRVSRHTRGFAACKCHPLFMIGITVSACFQVVYNIVGLPSIPASGIEKRWVTLARTGT